jgi:hypothetical protein
LHSLHDRVLCEWVGIEETDSAPEAGSASETESEEADGALTPRGEVNTKGSDTTEDAFFCFAYDASDGAPPIRHTTPLEAENAGTQGAPKLEIPCWTETTRVAEVTPPTNAAGVTEAAGVDRNNIPVSDGRRETDAPGARHEGDGLTLDKLEGLRRLEEVFGEQKSYMKRAWDDAMVSVKNKLVFAELDTLVMVAREAVERIIGTSARFVKEAYDQIPGTPDARGRRRPPFATQTDDQTVKDQNVHNRCVDRHG